MLANMRQFGCGFAITIQLASALWRVDPPVRCCLVKNYDGIEKAATSTNELAREQQKILKACYNTCNDVHIFSSLPPLRSPTHRRYMPKSWTFVQNVCSYITLLDTRCDHLLYASTPWVVCYALACPVSCLIGTLRASEVAQPRLHTMWYINCCCCGICCSKTSFWDLTIC